MFDHWNYMWSTHFWWGWAIWIVLLAVIVWAALTIAKTGRLREDIPGREAAVEILKKRYARGEISREEFEEKEENLAS